MTIHLLVRVKQLLITQFLVRIPATDSAICYRCARLSTNIARHREALHLYIAFQSAPLLLRSRFDLRYGPFDRDWLHNSALGVSNLQKDQQKPQDRRVLDFAAFASQQWSRLVKSTMGHLHQPQL